jgi:ribonuclease E
MVHNNKILTVSYGTFSCTLEGFDDSFGTMKAIAEYFRDLASDDRYFGAEPPQPDADMLARIAQREISRKVEAHENAGGIVLRARDFQAEPEPDPAPEQAGVPAPVTLPATGLDAAPSPGAADEAASEARQLAAPKAIADGGEDAVADSGEDAEIPEEPEKPTLITRPEIQAEIQDESQTDVRADVAADTAPATDMPDSHDEAVDDDFVSRGMEPKPEVQPVADILPGATSDIVPAADSIAAKLQRIRAVVLQNDASDTAEDYSEDEHAEAFVTATAQDITAAMQEDDAESEPQTSVEDDEISLALDRLDSTLAEEGTAAVPTGDGDEPTDAPDIAKAGSADPVPDESDAAETSADATAGTESAAPADSETVPGADPAEAVAETGDSLFGDLESDMDAGDDAGDDPDMNNILGGDKPQSRPRRARVVVVKREKLEAAISSGDLEEVKDDGAPQGSLSDADEDELLRELAVVEAELRGDIQAHETTPDAAFEDADTEEDAETAHAILSPTGEWDEEDMSRLMAKADQKMDDPKTSSSRETYSQMRAAVAVSQAEKSAGGTLGQHAGDDAYREDLASVVRPRRPVAAGKRPRRPATDAKPAPLKLVAEQRIDDGTGQTSRGPVRPRRVATVPVDDDFGPEGDATKGGFADYAAEVGATDLPDLLEAAAAYMSFVQGRAQFTRPQLMNKVRQVESSGFNREDGLRSFGQLLREGKIEKTGGGRFTASGRIGFRPDEMATG